MKKFTILSLVVVLSLVGFSANAQSQGDIRATAGLALGTKAAVDEGGTKAGLGINIGGEYFVTDIISVAPSYTFFFGSSITFLGETIETKPRALNIDGRYYFGDGDMQLYGLVGLSFASTKTEALGESRTDSDTGLNLGIGIQYPISEGMFLNGQMKYNTPFEQLVINLGATFSF